MGLPLGAARASCMELGVSHPPIAPIGTTDCWDSCAALHPSGASRPLAPGALDGASLPLPTCPLGSGSCHSARTHSQQLSQLRDECGTGLAAGCIQTGMGAAQICTACRAALARAAPSTAGSIKLGGKWYKYNYCLTVYIPNCHGPQHQC